MARALLRFYADEVSRGVLCLCGPGNNGGDARVIARVLREEGVANVRAFDLPADMDRLRKHTYRGEVLVDGLFGVGLDREVTGAFRDAIAWINRQQAPVVSVDLPSGLDADTGQVRGAAVRASLTLTVLPAKPGLFLRAGAELSGRVQGIAIDFPEEALRRADRIFLMTRSLVRKWWPKRAAGANKSKFGRAYVVAGSEGKWGAAVLTLRSAFRAGAGYVIAANADDSPILNELPEAMSLELPKLMRELKEKPGAVAVGPGVGFSEAIVDCIRELKKSGSPVVLDADALTLLARHGIRDLPRSWILTPHAGELSRLIGWPVDRIDGDPLTAAHFARGRFGCTVVLKGLHTVVASGYSGRCAIVPTGNVALAKAGTGDVLTGVIVGLLAQGLHPVKAALMGVYLHGLAGDVWVKKSSSASMSASDVVDLLPRIMKSFEETTEEATHV
jgi:NAD(P)H-hydrate epimerase